MNIGYGLGTLESLLEELTRYAEHLATYLDGGSLTSGSTLDLLEVSSAYLARAYDIERRLHEREQLCSLGRGAPEQRFRTGALESFIAQAKVCRDLGSRRLTFAQLQFESEKTGRDQ